MDNLGISTGQGIFPCLTEGSIRTNPFKGSRPRLVMCNTLQTAALAHKEIIKNKNK